MITPAANDLVTDTVADKAAVTPGVTPTYGEGRKFPLPSSTHSATAIAVGILSMVEENDENYFVLPVGVQASSQKSTSKKKATPTSDAAKPKEVLKPPAATLLGTTNELMESRGLLQESSIANAMIKENK